MKKILIGILTLFLILLIIGVILFFARDAVVKTVLSHGVKSLTGLTLTIGDINVGIPETNIGVKDIKLYNPPEYTDRVMIDMPEIYLDYHFGALLKKKIHIEELRIDLREFIVVKNKKGEVNLDSLKIVKDTTENKGKKETPPSQSNNLRIDIFQLKIGTVVFKDYSKGKKPQVKTYTLNLNERFEDITDISVLGSVILTKALMKTAIPMLINFPIDLFKNATGNVLGTATTIAVKSGEIAVKSGELAVNTVGETVEGAGKVIESVLPFGDKKK